MAVGQQVDDGERQGLCEAELVPGEEPRGLEDEAERQVEPRRAVPVVVGRAVVAALALAYAGGLFEGPIASEVLHLVEGEGFTVLVGGLHGVQLHDVQFAVHGFRWT